MSKSSKNWSSQLSVPVCTSCPPQASCIPHAAVTLPWLALHSPGRQSPHLVLIPDPRQLQVPFALFEAHPLSLPTVRHLIKLICPEPVSFSFSWRKKCPRRLMHDAHPRIPGTAIANATYQHAARCRRTAVDGSLSDLSAMQQHAGCLVSTSPYADPRH